MSRPLSNAETTFMPELHATESMHVVRLRGKCAWCGIPLSALGDQDEEGRPVSPRPVHAPNGKIVHTHPGGCTTAFRRVVNYRPEEVSSSEPGTSDPR